MFTCVYVQTHVRHFNVLKLVFLSVFLRKNVLEKSCPTLRRDYNRAVSLVGLTGHFRDTYRNLSDLLFFSRKSLYL